jgi:ABC-2 type transport system permease protein
MSEVLRHFKIWCAILKASMIAELEYRANIVGRVVTDVIWYITQLSLYEVLFRHSSQIQGWRVEEMRVFMGVLFLVDAFYMILFHDNLDAFSQKTAKGELDLLLAKPVNSQFMMSCSKVSTPYFINLIFIVAWLAWAIDGLATPVSLVSGLAAMIAAVCGLMVMYSMRFFFASMAILFTRAEAVMQFWYQIYRLATRPDSLYPPWLKWLVLTVVPAAFIVSVPANVLLGFRSWGALLAALILSSVLMILSHHWWQRVLRRYASASS